MTDGLTTGDLALLNTDNNGFGGNASWVIWLFFIFAMVGGNGFGWGGNSALAGYATQADIQRGFDNQNIMMRFDTISQNQTNAAYENAQLINQANINNMQSVANLTNAMSQGFNSLDSSITNSTYGITQTLNNGFNSVNQSLCGLSHQISDGVCAIKTQMLQDKYDALQNEYNLSTMANANAVQTQHILGAIGRWVANPPAPYYYGTTYASTTLN